MAAAPNPKVAPQPVEVLNLEKGSRQRGFIVVQEGSRDKKPFRLGRVAREVHP